MKRALLAVFVAFGCVLGTLGLSTPPVGAKPPKVDCTVYIYKPSTFWTRGAWRFKSTPVGWTTEDQFWYCSGRFRPQKKGPNRPKGPWGTTIQLNMGCTYQAEDGWLRDSYGWKQADIYISPWPE